MPDAADMGPSGEQAWQALRQHVEWSEGFWIAWLFTGNPRLAHEMEARMAHLLQERGQGQVVLRPRTPEEARNLLESVLGEDTRAAGCVWVEIIHSDGLALGRDIESPAGPWAEAWDWLMMRANERRTALANHLPGGLVLVAPPVFKDRTRRAAPDLWTIRSLVLEPSPPALPMMRELLDMRIQWPELSASYVPDTELALGQAARMHAQGHREAEATALMRAAQGLLAHGQTADALQRASEAVEAAGDEVDLRARALALLGEAEDKHGDPVAAERNLRAALDLAGERADGASLAWRSRLGDLLERRNAWEEAECVHLARVRQARSILQARPGDLDAVAVAMMALFRLGYARFQQRRLGEAEEVLEEALAHAAAEDPATSALESTSVSVTRLAILITSGELLRARGELDEAERRCRAGISLGRDLLQGLQDHHEAAVVAGIGELLRHAMSTLGKVLLARGEKEEAERFFQEALAFSERELVPTVG